MPEDLSPHLVDQPLDFFEDVRLYEEFYKHHSNSSTTNVQQIITSRRRFRTRESLWQTACEIRVAAMYVTYFCEPLFYL